MPTIDDQIQAEMLLQEKVKTDLIRAELKAKEDNLSQARKSRQAWGDFFRVALGFTLVVGAIGGFTTGLVMKPTDHGQCQESYHVEHTYLAREKYTDFSEECDHPEHKIGVSFNKVTVDDDPVYITRITCSCAIPTTPVEEGAK